MPAGPPRVSSIRLTAVLSLTIIEASHSSSIVMPSARCFSVNGELSTRSFFS